MWLKAARPQFVALLDRSNRSLPHRTVLHRTLLIQAWIMPPHFVDFQTMTPHNVDLSVSCPQRSGYRLLTVENSWGDRSGPNSSLRTRLLVRVCHVPSRPDDCAVLPEASTHRPMTP